MMRVCFFKLFFAVLLCSFPLAGGPSSVFWTNCTTDVYPAGTCHFDEDNYMTLFNQRGHGSSLPPDTGLEWGAFQWGNLSAETGVDCMGGTDDPVYFNFGIAIGEGKLFANAPSFKIGIFNVGTRTSGSKRTNQNIVDFIIGKTLPDPIGGRLFIGGFAGSHAMGRNNLGYMIAYDRLFCPRTFCDGTNYHQWEFCMDYASGKNTIGGGGAAVGYYFTPNISLLTGPVWFNSKKFNGNWKWSVQIGINFPVRQSNCK